MVMNDYAADADDGHPTSLWQNQSPRAAQVWPQDVEQELVYNLPGAPGARNVLHNLLRQSATV